jgi:PRTRC genetic system protein C
MALQVKGLKRVFLHNVSGKEVVLDDLNAKAKPETVKSLYSDQYPELATATIVGPVMKADRIEYRFSAKAGTKG